MKNLNLVWWIYTCPIRKSLIFGNDSDFLILNSSEMYIWLIIILSIGRSRKIVNVFESVNR